tara:strand:+ start:343 stop:993 length:651 start_codon:yes stop_codon:yes gene_type:complete
MMTQTVSAQVPTDNELWMGGALDLKLNKKWSVGLKEQFRINNNISTLNQTFTGLYGKYKINKYFGLRGNYRFVARPQKNNKTRISLDALAHWKKKDFPLSFGYRLRLQRAVISGAKNTRSYIRNKFSINYNLSKLVDPFIAYEIYFRPDKKEFRVSRLTLGLDWKLNKRMELTSFYRIQRDINVKKPARQNIIGVMFTYNTSWKKLTNKKSDKASI